MSPLEQTVVKKHLFYLPKEEDQIRLIEEDRERVFQHLKQAESDDEE
jgi:hypothetical protein